MEMYSPVRGPVRHDEYYMQGKVRVTVKPLEEIEAMLAKRFTGKIETIKYPLHSTTPAERQKDGRKIVDIMLPGSHNFEAK